MFKRIFREEPDDIWESAPKARPARPKRAPVVPATDEAHARHPRAYLVEQREGGGRRLALPESGEFVLGSGTGVDFVVEGDGVAERHAAVKAARTRYFVEDLGSDGGTFVNEEPVQPAHVLEEGDRLRIGDAVFQIHYPRS